MAADLALRILSPATTTEHHGDLYYAFSTSCFPDCRYVKLYIDFKSDSDRVPLVWLNKLPTLTHSLTVSDLSFTQAFDVLARILSDDGLLPNLQHAPIFQSLSSISSLELQALKVQSQKLCVKRRWNADQCADFTLTENKSQSYDWESHFRSRRVRQAWRGRQTGAAN